MAKHQSRPIGRSLREFIPLTPAEALLKDACRRGEFASVGNSLPDVVTEMNAVRASVLRFFLLGGDESAPVHEHGVLLSGGFVEGELDLEGVLVPHGFRLEQTNFSHSLNLRSVVVRGPLSLRASNVPGMNADSAVINGTLFLGGGFTATGSITLIGAAIDRNVDCRGGRSVVGNEVALLLDAARIKGDVNLGDGFRTNGEVRLMDAEIGGHLDCRGGCFDVLEGDALALDAATIKGNMILGEGFRTTGAVRLANAQIGGNFVCFKAIFETNGKGTLAARGASVRGHFTFAMLSPSCGGVDLTNASVGILVDDEVSWGSDLELNGFSYEALAGSAPVTAHFRLNWLSKQSGAALGQASDYNSFCRQPWRQVQNVLHEMGFTEEARRVAVEFERQLYKAKQIGRAPQSWGRLRASAYRRIVSFLHWGYGALTGYGHAPIKLLLWFIGIWLVSGVFYWIAALPPHGVFAPSNPLVFQESSYAMCAPGSAAALAEFKRQSDPLQPVIRGVGNWYLCEKLREEYAGLNPIMYSLDVILPLVDLGQEKAWGPLIPTPNADPIKELVSISWKQATRIVIWIETLFGWLASVLLAAIVSGLAKRSDE